MTTKIAILMIALAALAGCATTSPTSQTVAMPEGLSANGETYVRAILRLGELCRSKRARRLDPPECAKFYERDE